MYDLTIVSNLNIADGIGRQGLGLLSCIKEDLDCNFLALPPKSYFDLPKDLLPFVTSPFNHEYGNVTFWTYILGLNNELESLHASIKSPIKIAYSMFESTKIPKFWTDTLNKYYDLVVVPDEWLVQIYQNSGVQIPIFVLPLGIWLEDFLSLPCKQAKNSIFTFGMTGSFIARKNHVKVLQAFAKISNDFDCKLKLHGRFGPLKDKITSEVNKISGKMNIEFSDKPFSRSEYLKWFQELDCYVHPSMGEGFSVVPREALALGIPSIITNNSAQGTLSDSGYFCSLPSKIETPAKYEYFGNQQFGISFDCDVKDLCMRMHAVHDNYGAWLQKAACGREWVKQYLWRELKLKYLTLLKPKSISISDRNEIQNNVLLIKNQNLLNKYKKTFNL